MSTSNNDVKNIAEQDAIIGFKGMRRRPDGSFICRDQEYRIGETYVLSQEPKICNVGFHYCRTLEETFAYYNPDNKDYVYFVVKGWGKMVEDSQGSDPKLASSQLQVIRQVDRKDILITRLKKEMEKVDQILNDNPNAIISGSLALILLGLMPYRNIKDIDITLPYFGGFEKSVVNNRFGESGEETIQMILDGHITFDLFINPASTYTTIEFLGKKYRVSDFKPIIEAKFKYMLKGSEKHAGDLINVISELKRRGNAEGLKNIICLPEGKDQKIIYELVTSMSVPPVIPKKPVEDITAIDWLI